MGQETASPLTDLVTGLAFPEGLRWRGDRLWFSDIEARRVCSVDLAGRLRTEVELDDHPSGLGWLPDGTLLVVSMRRQSILAVSDGRVRTYSDVSRHALSHLNDMIVGDDGRAYVGSMGYDVWVGERFRPGNICIIEQDGTARVGAENLAFPNGMAIDRGRTLIVAESVAQTLTAFDIGNDGLTSRRQWAPTKGKTPDGIALDRSGAIWIASAHSGEVIRYREGGTISALVRLPADSMPYSVAIGEAPEPRLFVGSSSPFSATMPCRIASIPGTVSSILLR